MRSWHATAGYKPELHNACVCTRCLAVTVVLVCCPGILIGYAASCACQQRLCSRLLHEKELEIHLKQAKQRAVAVWQRTGICKCSSRCVELYSASGGAIRANLCFELVVSQQRCQRDQQSLSHSSSLEPNAPSAGSPWQCCEQQPASCSFVQLVLFIPFYTCHTSACELTAAAVVYHRCVLTVHRSEGQRPFGASRSMEAQRLQSSVSSSAFQMQEPTQQQQVSYTSLEDFSSRVEIYKGRWAMAGTALQQCLLSCSSRWFEFELLGFKSYVCAAAACLTQLSRCCAAATCVGCSWQIPCRDNSNMKCTLHAAGVLNQN